jgi:hypothetical protein
MLFKLSVKNKVELLKLPESGFGYQVIQAYLNGSNELRKYVVFNAEILVEYNNDLDFYTNTLIGYCYQMLISSLAEVELSGIELVETEELNSGLIDSYHAKKEILFVRPTIYQNDNRIDETNNCIIPGSCLTTYKNFSIYNDKGNGAFKAFTLPQLEEIRRIYYFKIPYCYAKYAGIISSNFGKAGGGEKYISKQEAAVVSKDIILSIGIVRSVKKLSNIGT